MQHVRIALLADFLQLLVPNQVQLANIAFREAIHLIQDLFLVLFAELADTRPYFLLKLHRLA